ncbi:MAG: hypothetical protein IJL30_02250 [Clostridia bacterium]|nr:hypothetical protein [Clostridia bacterium]
MNREQFAAIMPYITENLAGMIAKNRNISESAAITALYESKLYALLEKEDSKLWQYSTKMLCSLFDEEQSTGDITFPDV